MDISESRQGTQHGNHGDHSRKMIDRLPIEQTRKSCPELLYHYILPVLHLQTVYIKHCKDRHLKEQPYADKRGKPSPVPEIRSDQFNIRNL